ncbi:uncharacterized protein LOC123507686 [Portunus trituberculatus]|uniref:uncharacterized protein LOC123507686 n=1 Tax=Portunus trituberculatus TaxID=210409 RepID=UPI001E1CB514|nr:uncharacterized protein LOC123507686 [Portunus trituberculatus]
MLRTSRRSALRFVTVNSEPVKADVGTSANTPGQTHASSSTQSHLQSPAAVSYNPVLRSCSKFHIADVYYYSLHGAVSRIMETRGQATAAQTLDKLMVLIEAQQSQVSEDRRLVREQNATIQQLMSQVLVPRSNDAADGDATTPQPAPRRHVSRPHAQPPHKLSPDSSLREFKVWRSTWSYYEELLQLHDQPVRTQVAHLRSCLTPEMRGTLAHAVGIAEDENTSR